MLASDFILQTKSDLQEKSEHWTVEDLFIKLQRSYVSLQSDLPYFMGMEEVSIKKGKIEYRLENIFLKDVSFVIDGIKYEYDEIENVFISTLSQNLYSYHDGKIILNKLPQKDSLSKMVYKYEKKLKNKNCFLEIPTNWHKALRLLFMSEIHEKPTGNTKERVLSEHYIKKYDKEVIKIKQLRKTVAKNVTSQYQRV